jgi:hypothetical protein
MFTLAAIDAVEILIILGIVALLIIIIGGVGRWR